MPLVMSDIRGPRDSHLLYMVTAMGELAQAWFKVNPEAGRRSPQAKHAITATASRQCATSGR